MRLLPLPCCRDERPLHLDEILGPRRVVRADLLLPAACFVACINSLMGDINLCPSLCTVVEILLIVVVTQAALQAAFVGIPFQLGRCAFCMSFIPLFYSCFVFCVCCKCSCCCYC